MKSAQDKHSVKAKRKGEKVRKRGRKREKIPFHNKNKDFQFLCDAHLIPLQANRESEVEIM